MRGLTKVWKRSEGSALLEFAIVLPLLVVFIVGIYDFSGAFNEKQKIGHAAQEGAVAAGAQRPAIWIHPREPGFAAASGKRDLQFLAAARRLAPREPGKLQSSCRADRERRIELDLCNRQLPRHSDDRDRSRSGSGWAAYGSRTSVTVNLSLSLAV